MWTPLANPVRCPLCTNVSFLDAASCLTDAPAGEAHGPDGMHLDESDHEKLALAMAEKLKEMLG